jgi:hypothetical protein
MKKIFLLIFVTFLFVGCENGPVSTFVDTVVNWFVDIEPNRTTGTVNSEFTFTANTNDSVVSWMIDGEEVSNNSRSAEASFTFEEGDHIVSVLTENGAEDEVTISVSGLTPVFKMTGVQRAVSTELYLDYPILTVDGIEYDVTNMENTYNVSISETEENIIIDILIEVDSVDFFYFMNDNALNLEGVDIQNMNIDDFNHMLEVLYPERYIEPEPEYSIVKYSLSGVQRATTDTLHVYADRVTINGENTLYEDMSAVYVDDSKMYQFTIGVDSSDFFLFMSGNCQNFFGFEPDDMSFEQFEILADVIRRYPEESIFDLSREYNP